MFTIDNDLLKRTEQEIEAWPDWKKAAYDKYYAIGNFNSDDEAEDEYE